MDLNQRQRQGTEPKKIYNATKNVPEAAEGGAKVDRSVTSGTMNQVSSLGGGTAVMRSGPTAYLDSHCALARRNLKRSYELALNTVDE
jgi:hypothetical protein